jgi:hypothetical protein
MESKTLSALHRFTYKAEKLGKYRPGTAAGFRAALRALQEGLTLDDPDDPGYVSDHLEDILHRQVEKTELAPTTLHTYLQRVTRVLNDWRAYGQNPKALLNWHPKTVERRSRYQIARQAEESRLKTLTWSLRPDLVIQLQLPIDFNTEDFARLRKFLELELELSHEKSQK